MAKNDVTNYEVNSYTICAIRKIAYTQGRHYVRSLSPHTKRGSIKKTELRTDDENTDLKLYGMVR